MGSTDPQSTTGGGEGSAARDRLIALRTALLRLHKTLLELERREYERVNGQVSIGELFRLVIDHPQFAWLHSISEFVVRVDELLAGKSPVTAGDAHENMALARKLFSSSESGDEFQKRYFSALRREPAVVVEHAELARLFASEPAELGET
jgi:hypothetical protein